MKRDCPAVLIPAGTAITLQAGVPVVIVQDLGGSYTVLVHGNMARIAGADADALGKEAPAAALPSNPGRLTEEEVYAVLRTCYDPEIPVNIVELGLVYDLQVLPLPEGGHRVEIKMTLDDALCLCLLLVSLRLLLVRELTRRKFAMGVSLSCKSPS